MKIIGLDVGEKRIGVAKVDSSTRIALPVGFVENDEETWEKIASVARMNSTNWFVLGLPRSNEGNETKQTLYVRQFARVLMQKIPGAKIRFQDESLTSVEAEARLKKRKKKYERGEIDAEAATIILQDFIETFKADAEAKKKQAKATPKAVPKTTPKDAVVATVKKSTDKVKLEAGKVSYNTKKMTNKTGKWKFLIIAVIIAALVGGAAFGVVTAIRAQRAREREEYYKELEAEMEPDVFKFTITPGETIFDVKKKFAEIGYSSEDIEAGFNAEYDFDFLASRPAGASLEGYLLGETHEFYKSATVRDVLTRFLEGTRDVIDANDLTNKYAEKGLSLYEGITLASVVQKEAMSGEMPTVAQVFLTRLSYGWLLGSDVTTSYALDVVDPNREVYTDNAAALTIDSCYNTRLYAGLPCGPISNPSLTALLAVANPSDTAYLYFLTGDDGVMYYSYTEAEHNQNAYLHCQTLCNVSL